MPETTLATRRIGPHSHPTVLAKLDQRTKEARLIRETRAELVRHVGGRPSVTQALLIERATALSLQIALMDRAFVEKGSATERDGRQYLAWSNALARTVRLLGLKGAAERSPSLSDYLASRSETAKQERTADTSPAPVVPPAERRGRIETATRE